MSVDGRAEVTRLIDTFCNLRERASNVVPVRKVMNSNLSLASGYSFWIFFGFSIPSGKCQDNITCFKVSHGSFLFCPFQFIIDITLSFDSTQSRRGRHH